MMNARVGSIWEQALDAGDQVSLLRINAFHLAAFPGLSPLFADLCRELRFTDFAETAKAAFIAEVLRLLRDDGPVAAGRLCRSAIAQLEIEYARRHRCTHGYAR